MPPLATEDILKEEIEIKINELGILAENNKALILTEVDLQCLLYKKLSEINYLSELTETDDGYFTNKIHTEVSWLGATLKTLNL